MKLATLQDGSRDGQLVVVSRDLSHAHYATGIAHRMQQVLDDWGFLSPQLQDLYTQLNQGRARHAFPFNPAQCMAPLPRAHQWAEGSAYLQHEELVRQALGVEAPAGPRTEPLMQQGGSDGFLGPCDDIAVPSEAMGIDFGAGLAVATGDVRMGTGPEEALDAIRLLMLVNGVHLRHLMPAELASGLGLLHSRPATAFGPVAVTPDELGPAWQDGRVHLALHVAWNGRRMGLVETGPDMHFHFGQLIAHLARTRHVRAGTLVGGGTVSNPGVGRNGRLEWPRGHACIAEKRGVQARQAGAPATEFMKFGDTVHVEMKGPDGRTLFGAIEQEVVQAGAVRPERGTPSA